MNALKVCQSHQNWLRIMDDIGDHLCEVVQEEMSKGLRPRLIFDNFDFRISAGEMLQGVENKDRHWICQFLTFDRISTENLDNTTPQGKLEDFELKEYLLTHEEQQQTRNEYIILVLRILLKYIPWLSTLKKLVPDHIEHTYSKEMSMKSTIISLPVKLFNQNKLQDVVQYLDSVESFVKKITGTIF